jgi:hypothetical protein
VKIIGCGAGKLVKANSPRLKMIPFVSSLSALQTFASAELIIQLCGCSTTPGRFIDHPFGADASCAIDVPSTTE